jgi:hypothetical protein
LTEYKGTGATTTVKQLLDAKNLENEGRFNAKQFVAELTPNTSSHTNEPESKFKMKRLQYPTTVGQMQDGHYIIFEIHAITKPKFKSQDPLPTPTGGDVSAGVKFAEFQKENLRASSLMSRTKSQHTLHHGSKRVATQIALYMPPSVQVAYKSNYEDSKIGVAADSIYRFLEDPSKETAGPIASEMGVRFARAAIDTLIPGFTGVNEIQQGKILSDRMELFFKGVGRRSFQYTFVFVPKSEQEAIDVDSIVHEFKTAMLPEYAEGFDAPVFGSTNSDRILSIPTTFDIKYLMHFGGGAVENGFLNKISTCYLTDAQVAYGGDKFSAHRPAYTNRAKGGGAGDETGVNSFGAPPQRTTLTLTFTEIEIITKEAARTGY